MFVELLKALFTSLFRLFPLPAKTGLLRIGDPDAKAPVLVTGNYELTVKRLLRALRGQNCYLLVAPTRGINVWCAATGGIFTENSVVVAVKTTGIGRLVSHRTLILPQLSAAGIDCEEIKRRTGWSCLFGPVYAKDLPAYIEARYRKSPAMLVTRFPIGQRLEQALSPTVLLSLILLPGAIFLPWSLVGHALLLLWALSLFQYVFFFQLPGEFAYRKGLFAGIVFTIVEFAYLALSHRTAWYAYLSAAAGTILLALLISLEVPSVSPLWRCFRSRLKEAGLTRSTVALDWEKCNGCGRCLLVCPKGCFEISGESKKALVLPERICLKCKACIQQCHPDALQFAKMG